MKATTEEINQSLYGRGRNKYGVSRDPSGRTADGVVFASKRESVQYQKLKVLLCAGAISELELQPKFPIIINSRHVCTYVADFSFRWPDGRIEIQDSKGFRTPLYRLKKKLVEASYNVTIHEV